MTDLQNYLQSHFGIPNQKLATVASFFKTEQLAKDEFFLKAGQYSQRLSFVRSGLLRLYINTERKEVTQWITTPDYFVTDLGSLYFEQPARCNIQALTDCELYSIQRQDFYNLNQVVPEWEKLQKLFLAKCFMTLEERVFSFLSMTAEERFTHLFQYQPELFNLVPLHYLASMLGMTPETLSRIRKKLTS
ncbi:MAG: Crp/Fnr family transcriptional regulator [Saprospiraceae bacterium]